MICWQMRKTDLAIFFSDSTPLLKWKIRLLCGEFGGNWSPRQTVEQITLSSFWLYFDTTVKGTQHLVMNLCPEILRLISTHSGNSVDHKRKHCPEEVLLTLCNSWTLFLCCWWINALDHISHISPTTSFGQISIWEVSGKEWPLMQGCGGEEETEKHPSWPSVTVLPNPTEMETSLPKREFHRVKTVQLILSDLAAVGIRLLKSSV